MASFFSDNVYTTAFTPREYQVELLDAALERNIIVCLGTPAAKTFISIKLIQELANDVRRGHDRSKKYSIYIDDGQNIDAMAICFRNLTDLKVVQFKESFEPSHINNLESANVIVTSSKILWDIISSKYISMREINVLIIDQCHRAVTDENIKQLMNEYGKLASNLQPRILGLASPLFQANSSLITLEASLNRLESILHSKTETASDILTLLRYSNKPNELIIKCDRPMKNELTELLIQHITKAKEFLNDHRYDPFEMYEDEFREELQNIPDPKTDPHNIFEDFLDILNTLGPWCADRAALLLLMKIEKLKIKTPYERHFLLLCMASSVMVQVRCICDDTFKDLTELERITNFSTSKVLRLIELLKQFKPENSTPIQPLVTSVNDSENLKNNGVVLKDMTNSLTKDCSVILDNTGASDNNCQVAVINNALIKSNIEADSTNDSDKNANSEDKNESSSEKQPSLNNRDTIIEKIESTSNFISKEIIFKDPDVPLVVKVDEGLTKYIVEKNRDEVFFKNKDTSRLNDCKETEQNEYSEIVNKKFVQKSSDDDNAILCSHGCENIQTECDSVNFKYENNIDNNDILSCFKNNYFNCPENLTIIKNKCCRCIQQDNTDSCKCISSCSNKKKPPLETCLESDILTDEKSFIVNNLEASDSNILSDKCQQNSKLPETALVNYKHGGRQWKGRGPKTGRKIGFSQTKSLPDPDTFCCIIFVKQRFTAKVMFYLLCELNRNDTDLAFISAQFTMDKIANPVTDVREAEQEHRTQEEVLKKFRMHECNLLVATSVLEEGIDVPKCNLVIRFDAPQTYRSYVHSKGRAKMPGAYHVFIIEQHRELEFIKQLAEYYQIEKVLLRKCANTEPPESEEQEADSFTSQVESYRPLPETQSPSVNMSTAIALVNRYCAKLPSDTFTRLTPLWNIQTVEGNTEAETLYQCILRLPINSPLKQNIVGTPMKTRVLARRIAALRACKALHEVHELDDQLQPIGKEGFRAFEPDWDNFPLDADDEVLAQEGVEPRPGTTKRRQYYYKRIAEALVDCRPKANEPTYLYYISMVLTCPLPEEQNTRGRKIYPPEDSPQGFGILTSKRIPKICPFPIFTRSGEVSVMLELSKTQIVLTSEQLKKICEFLNYMFTSVLRLQKFLMMFDPEASENSYFVVPTYYREESNVTVDWNFLDRIYENKDLKPRIIPEENRKDFTFEPSKYHDAVVMPWYRNQDQPQFFYVAEICVNLNPKSSFPGTDYKTFEEYYFRKYDIQIQNTKQPLLDVDHTSARLNFLTPRYVNRKGVALPTSSEETKRAKRENLEQKQILVPELCTVHPFPASLWRKAVCLPCILYRINALLLADQIRVKVAHDLALGQCELDNDFLWPQLDFGWSLAEVLQKSKEAKMIKQNSASELPVEKSEVQEKNMEIAVREGTADSSSDNSKDWMEIGTWSNEMADCFSSECLDDFEENRLWIANSPQIRYGSPTSMIRTYNPYDDFDSSDSDDSYDSEVDMSDDSTKGGGLRIEFKGDNIAEAIEDEESLTNTKKLLMLTQPILDNSSCSWYCEKDDPSANILQENFESSVEEHKKLILTNGMVIGTETPVNIKRKGSEGTKVTPSSPVDLNNLLTVKSIEAKHIDLNKENTPTNYIDYFEYEEPPTFSFDAQPNLIGHPGPSPSVILQALTMSNANDGINLERLETIGDSFLKYAITTYLYCTYENVHEGKLSHLRSKQVSNLNLYRLGRKKVFGESMIATKFEPHDNWLPPCYYVPKELEQALIDAKVPASHWNRADMPAIRQMTREQICEMVREKGEQLGIIETDKIFVEKTNTENIPCFIPYNLLTQHSIPDKSVADCVEALIGAYLIECGPRGALLFMAWLGIRVLPIEEKIIEKDIASARCTGSLAPVPQSNNLWKQTIYGNLKSPRSPLLRHVEHPEEELERLLDGYDSFERTINYRFRDRSYLLQALTHASYYPNRLTDCYQRLEFLGDAVLDYLITRHLYEDSRQHSPGALTDLRSALVNNTIFASLAVRYGFHKYFRHLSPGLHEVVNRFVRIQEGNGHAITEEYYLIEEDECEEVEDVEVPKALGDVFESVAGAIFLDSGMSLDAVWRVYYRMMKQEIELFSTRVPKSPIRELLELEPETAKFGKPEKLADGRRVRVSVEVFGKGTFKGIGRNYRIAKCTAAKCALKQLKKRGLLNSKS